MDSIKPNTSSDMAGIFSYAPYQASDVCAHTSAGTQGAQETRNDSGSDVSGSAPSSPYDSISISPQARRLYDATASAPSALAVSLLGMPTENIALYNQIRRERDALAPGDPRIVELTDKLRAVIMAGDKALDQDDLSYHPGNGTQNQAAQDQTTDQEGSYAFAQPKTAERTDTVESKNRHARRAPQVLYARERGGDSAGFSFALPYPAADASTEATPFSAHASSSASPRLHRAAPGMLGYQGSGPASSGAAGRMYRVA